MQKRNVGCLRSSWLRSRRDQECKVSICSDPIVASYSLINHYASFSLSRLSPCICFRISFLYSPIQQPSDWEWDEAELGANEICCIQYADTEDADRNWEQSKWMASSVCKMICYPNVILILWLPQLFGVFILAFVLLYLILSLRIDCLTT